MPDALSWQFSDPKMSHAAETILPIRCFVGAVSWRIERRVQNALKGEPIHKNCPTNCLFVDQICPFRGPAMGSFLQFGMSC